MEALYQRLLDAWNEQDADQFAALFAPDGHSVGFDGTEMHGPEEMRAALSSIFADHPTAKYVSKLREVRSLSPNVTLLRAVAGMVSRADGSLVEAAHAVHTVVAVKQDERFQIALFQNTPAAYHGRPEARAALTAELLELVPALK